MKVKVTRCQYMGCGAEIVSRTNVRYCDACRIKAKKASEAKAYEREKAQKMAYENRVEDMQISKPRFLSDEEQRAHDRALDKKYDQPCTTVVYKRGTAAFKEVAQEIISKRRVCERVSEKHEAVGFLPSSIRQYVGA